MTFDLLSPGEECKHKQSRKTKQKAGLDIAQTVHTLVSKICKVSIIDTEASVFDSDVYQWLSLFLAPDYFEDRSAVGFTLPAARITPSKPF